MRIEEIADRIIGEFCLIRGERLKEGFTAHASAVIRPLGAVQDIATGVTVTSSRFGQEKGGDETVAEEAMRSASLSAFADKAAQYGLSHFSVTACDQAAECDDLHLQYAVSVHTSARNAERIRKILANNVQNAVEKLRKHAAIVQAEADEYAKAGELK